VIAGLVTLAFAAPAAAEGGHLPGFGVADQKVAIAKLPDDLRFTFGGIPGAKGFGLPHVGKGPVWFGEVQRPKGTIDVAGNGRWVCVSETRPAASSGGSSCTTPAAARDLGLIDVSGGCGKGPPRHFRVYGVVPDGATAVRIEKLGGAPGRSVPVIENTFAFTIGRENIVLHGSGDPAAEELERTLPLAWAGKHFDAGGRPGDCSTYTFAESRKPDEGERAP
jgi:hypothetical protein